MSFDVLYLSPHPDDAVFSSGGAIALEARAGRRVGVVTVFSRTGEETEADRREEDRRAIERLGAARIELGFPDAPVRDARYRRPSWLLGPMGDREGGVVEAVRAALGRVVAGAPRVVAPLGVGQHIDHQIVHAAAAGLEGDLSFYEDMPYALERFAVARRLARLGVGGPPRGGRFEELRSLERWWRAMPFVEDRYPPVARRVAAAVLATTGLRGGGGGAGDEPRGFTEERIDINGVVDDKLEAIAAYRSQWPLFHRGLDQWRRALVDYSVSLGSLQAPVERRWRENER